MKTNYKNLALVNGYQVCQAGTSIWKADKHLHSLDSDQTNCPDCGSILNNDQTRIPVTVAEEAVVHTLYCSKCRKSYVHHSDRLAAMMKDNPATKGYTLDGRELWNIAAKKDELKRAEQRIQDNTRRKAMLQAVSSSVVMVCVRFADNRIKEYIIVNDAQSSNLEKDVLHYSSVSARELLTAALYEQRERKGILDGKSFYVAKLFFEDGPHTELPDCIVPTELAIEAGGGLYSSLKRSHREIVEMLLYSPYTGRYEIIKATLNKDEGYCFVDVCLYRSFAKEYGNPGIRLVFDRNGSGKRSWNELNAESILKDYGYSVSKAEGLTVKERHELLAEIIDLSILPVEKVLSHLEFTIRTHPLEKDYIPRLKWAEDKKFVENYRSDPSRFLIAK